MAKFKTIDQSELDDLNKVLGQGHLREEDITLKEHDVEEISAGGGLYHPVGKVTITNKSNKKSKVYSTGHGSSWVADFSSDLQSGAFS